MGHLQSMWASVEVVILLVLNSEHFTGTPMVQIGPGCRRRRTNRWALRRLLRLLEDGIDFHRLIVQADARYVTEGQWGYGYVIYFRILFRFFRLTAVLVVLAQIQGLRRDHVVHVQVVQRRRLHHNSVG